MPTTVHLPPILLERVDQCARSLKLSRNRFIRQALEKTIQEQMYWSPVFLTELDNFTPLAGKDKLLNIIQRHRRSKSAPKL